MSQLVTGEAVALDLRPAALPSRLIAGLIDVLVQFLVLLVLGSLATAVSLGRSEAAVSALGLVVVVLVLIVYPVTFETLLRGRTPGKAAMGLRVVRDDGGPIGFRQALVRGLAGAFLERPGVTLFTAAVVSSLLNDQGKRVGDLLAGTIVRRERVSVRGGQVAGMPPPLASWAAGLDLSGFPDGLALSVRQFVARADQLTDSAREELGGRLVRAATEVVGPPPPGAPGWAVLSAVLAERRRRETERLGERSYVRSAPGQPQPGGAQPGGPQPGGAAGGPPSPVPPPAAPVAPTRESPPAVGPGGFAAPF
ncbi:MAG: RDD family protein [Mycobacteriales bacterium]